jgi:hypothetical protein
VDEVVNLGDCVSGPLELLQSCHGFVGRLLSPRLFRGLDVRRSRWLQRPL